MERRLLQNLGRLAIILALTACASSAAGHDPRRDPSPLRLPIVRRSAWLTNPSFELGEGGDCSPSTCPQEIRPPLGWTANWRDGVSGICDTPTGQPEMLPFDGDPFRVFAGDWSLKYFTFWRCQWVTVSQEVRLPPGSYRVSAQVQSWFSGCSSQPYHPGEPLDDQCNPAPWAHLHIRIGIGDAWSEWVEAYNEWKLIEATVNLDATASVLVSVESQSFSPLKHQDVYIDDVRIKVHDPGGF